MEENKLENPAAFPILDPNGSYYNEGMSLRDYFAAKALQGAWASHANPNAGSPIVEGKDNYNETAKQCYKIADAMLKQRNQ